MERLEGYSIKVGKQPAFFILSGYLLPWSGPWSGENKTTPGAYTFYYSGGYGCYINIPGGSGVIQLKVRTNYSGEVQSLTARVYNGTSWGTERSF